MDAATIVTHLRSAGYLLGLVDSKIRLYGDAGTLPPALREALVATRDAVVAHLDQPEQSIAHDLIANAAEAGWFPSINGSNLEWRRDDERTANPMRSDALRSALEQNRDAVLAVLRQVSASCPDRPCGVRLGTCPKDIEASGCTAKLSETPVIPPSTAQEVTAEPLPERAYHRIWSCAGCQLPRSGDDRPCPTCGATEGFYALRPATRLTNQL